MNERAKHNGNNRKASNETGSAGHESMTGSLPGLQPLTAQEQKVLKLVAEARTNKEIAGALAISPATAKRHLENILRKLNLKNRVSAAVYAVSEKADVP